MLILTDRRNYERIGDAIRDVARTDARFLPSEMPDAIRNVPKIAMPVDVISKNEIDFELASSAPNAIATATEASYAFPMDIVTVTRAERG